MKKRLVLVSALFLYHNQALCSGELDDSYIDILFKKQLYTFHHVKMDYDENPFVSLSNLSDWSDTNIECNPSSKMCIIENTEFQRIVSFDAMETYDEFGDSVCRFDEFEFLVEGEQYWFRFDAISKCLPYNTTWTLRSYELFLQPLFKLKKERLDEIQKQRTQMMSNSEAKRKASEQHDAIVAPSELEKELMLEYSARYDNGSFSNGFSSEFVMDIEKGSLFGSLQVVDGASSFDWNYEKQNGRVFDYTSYGKGRSPSIPLTSLQATNASIYIDKIELSESLNTFDLDEYVGVDSEVDIFRNGFYLKTVHADNAGRIQENGISASIGDNITLRILSKEGTYVERTIQVNGERGSLLSNGEWDYELFADFEGNNFALKNSFGLSDGITAGVTLLNSDQGGDYVAHAGWQPSPWLMTQANISSDKFLLKGYFNYFKSSPFYVELLDVNEEDAFDDSYLKLTQNWGLSKYHQENTFTLKEKSYGFDTINRYKFNNRATLKYEFSVESEDIVRTNHNLGLNYNLGDEGSLDLAYNYSETNKNLTVNFRYMYTGKIGYMTNDHRNNFINARFKISDDQIDYRLSADWNFTPYLTGELGFSNDVVFASLSLSTTIKPSQEVKHKSKDAFGNAKIEGILYYMQDGKRVPVEGITLYASNYKTVSDSNGHYVFERIPSDDEVKVFIDESGLDVNMTPKENEVYVQSRPATVARVDFLLLPVVGVDGYIVDVIADEVEFISGNKTVKANVDEDGFFLFEKLSSGTSYVVKAYSDGKLVKETKFTVTEDYWESDVKL
ncbi:TPA: hypothetical protein RI821_002842 [Vibrio cholerae]|uniref:Uncharacterized protein n=1 Tax=Vibrio cholerae TaxID=666 RepID=A0A5Q6PKG6_VIBCL|nr:hypothetical protein [Vibrio cholerae]KAA1255150.1 hypothetical protein F0M16_07995 [Vibrio cholerae]HDV5624282.1 hypothetical protein [Vibrio cholerae]